MNGAEASSVWSDWKIDKEAEYPIFEAAGLAGPDNTEWNNVVEHSLVVNAVALVVSDAIINNGVLVDRRVVDQASILHDISKRLEKEAGISYDTEHDSQVKRNLLQDFGYAPEVVTATELTGRVPGMFIGDAASRLEWIQSQPIESLVVAYADARTRNTNIVSLEHARELNKLKVPADANLYDMWFAYYAQVEEVLYALIPEHSPSDLSEAAMTSYVTAIAA